MKKSVGYKIPKPMDEDPASEEKRNEEQEKIDNGIFFF